MHPASRVYKAIERVTIKMALADLLIIDSMKLVEDMGDRLVISVGENHKRHYVLKPINATTIGVRKWTK